MFKKLQEQWNENRALVLLTALGMALTVTVIAFIPHWMGVYRMNERIDSLEKDKETYESSLSNDSWAEGIPMGDSLVALGKKGAKQEIATIEKRLKAWEQFKNGEIEKDDLPLSEQPYAP